VRRRSILSSWSGVMTAISVVEEGAFSSVVVDAAAAVGLVAADDVDVDAEARRRGMHCARTGNEKVRSRRRGDQS
jgi:hypothetical protein